MGNTFLRSILLVTVLISTFAVPFKLNDDNNPCPKPDTNDCIFGLPTFEYEQLLSEMIANPTPPVQPIPVKQAELGVNSSFRIVGGIAPIFDGPDGNPIGALDFGFFP